MKKLLSAIFVISSLFIFAQVPQGINYQSIIRNTSGTVLPSTAVNLEFKLYSGLSGAMVYDETHSATTNSFGMVNLVIGQGTPLSGNFSTISWSSGIAYEVWVNSAMVGTRQLFMSVPYALYAEKAGNSSPTPTLSINSPNTVANPSAGVYTISVPSQSLSVSGNSVSISDGNTVVIPTGITYTQGQGIDISGSVISGTANITGTGATTVTGVYPNLVISSPTMAAQTPPTITGAGSATVTSAGNTFTVDVPSSVPPAIAGDGATTVTSSGNTFTVSTPAAITPTVTGSGLAAVTPTTGYVFNLDVPAPVLSYNQGTKELSITQGTAVTTQTLIGTGSNAISIVGSDMATVTPTTGSTFTVSVPSPTLNVVGGTLTGAYPTQTLTIPSSSTTLVQGSNVTLNQSGNTYTVSSSSQSLTVNSNSLSITGGNTVTIPTASVVSGNPNITVNQSGNTYSVSAVPQALSIASNSVITLTNGGSVSITPAVLSYTPATNVLKLTDGLSSNTFTLSTPPLALSGTTLTSGAATNSVNLAAMPGLWSASSTTAVVLTNMTNRVGIGTSSPNAALEIAVTNTVTGGLQVNITNVNNNNNAVQVTQNGIGNAGYFETNNASGSSSAIAAFSNGLGSTIKAVNTNTTSAGSHGILSTAISGSAVYATNSSTTAAAILASNSSGDAIYGTAANGRAFYGSNNSTSGLSTMELSSSGNGPAMFVYKNTGASGSVGSFANNEASNASDALQVFTNGTGSGISSSNTNTSPTSYAGVFDGGITTKGKTTTSSGYALRAFNSTATSLLSVRNDAIVEIGANVGINILNPTYRLQVNSSFANAAAYIENITATSTASLAHGLYARASSTHSLAAAVYGENLGTGPSIYGIKNASETGIGGRFELLNPSNSGDAVLAISSGAGAALHTTSAPTSTIALWAENGHLKSTQSTMPSITTVSTSTSFNGATYTPTNATDVKGSLLAVCTTTSGASVYAGSVITFRVTFVKQYAISPTVVLTPTTDLGGLSYFVSGITGSSFNITVKNSTTATITPSSLSFSFNYFVIE